MYRHRSGHEYTTSFGLRGILAPEGELNGANAISDRFKTEFRTIFEAAFPGALIDFGPRPVNVLPSIVIHLLL